MGKYLTIVLITEKTSKVKKVRIPINLLIFLSILVAVAFSFTGYVFYNYYTNTEKILDIDELRVTYDRKALKISSYYQHLSEMSLSLDRLNETRKKMKTLTGLELTENSDTIANNEKKLLKEYNSGSPPSVLGLISDINEINKQSLNNETVYYEKFIGFVTDKNRQQYLFFSPKGIPAEGMVLSGFQYETDPFSSHVQLLNGVTIGVKGAGSNVSSTGDGIVTRVLKDDKNNSLVEIYHNSAYKTRYSLLAGVSVQIGDMVKKNQLIGTAGEGQEFAFPHYHYEVLLFNIPQNPNKYRSDEYLEEIIH